MELEQVRRLLFLFVGEQTGSFLHHSFRGLAKSRHLVSYLRAARYVPRFHPGDGAQTSFFPPITQALYRGSKGRSFK